MPPLGASATACAHAGTLNPRRGRGETAVQWKRGGV
jgi:hypothetical protein